jgi:hypothetical protein
MPVSLMGPKCTAKINAPSLPGRQVRCPGCNVLVAIPAAKATPEPEPVEVAELDDLHDEDAAPEPAARPARSERALRDQKGDDEGKSLDEPRRGHRPTSGQLPSANRVLRVIVWGLCLVYAVVLVMHYHTRLPEAKSAIQEAFLAADACVWLIFGYIIARALDRILGDERSRRSRGGRLAGR